MRCEVNSCINNQEGYCVIPDYVEINRGGECNQLYIPSIDLGLKHKTTKEND